MSTTSAANSAPGWDDELPLLAEQRDVDGAARRGVAAHGVELDDDGVDGSKAQCEHQLGFVGLDEPQLEPGVGAHAISRARARSWRRTPTGSCLIRIIPLISRVVVLQPLPGQRERVLDVLGGLGQREAGGREHAPGRRPLQQGVAW